MKSPAIEGRRNREEPYVLDDQVGFVLRQAQQRHPTIFAAEMIEGVTPTQWAALAKLRECGARVSPGLETASVCRDCMGTDGHRKRSEISSYSSLRR